jgi:ABC-type lipoprotein export system ATPase subunit
MIEIRNLRKTYPGNREATLKAISLSFPETGLFCLVGKSGAGKSTLLALLGGMDRAYEGSLRVNGKELRELSEKEMADFRFETVTFAFQDFKAEDKESVEDNLLKTLAITSLSSPEKEERIEKELRRVGLAEKRKALFGMLSGGEKKRISLVRALLKDSPILLADEPLASLNPSLRRDITKVFLEESKRRLVILITHEEKEIPASASVYSLEDGKIKTVRLSKPESHPIITPSYSRRPFQGKAFFHSLLTALLSQRAFLTLTLFTLALGLFSITFSFQLSESVSESLVTSLSSYMEDDSFVVRPKDESFQGTGYETADPSELSYLARAHPEEIESVSSFYLTSLDALFKDRETLTLSYQNSSVREKRLSLNSFLYARSLGEVTDTIYGKKESLTENEVILGADEETLSSLFLLFSEKVPADPEPSLPDLGKRLERDEVTLKVSASLPEAKYQLESSFIVRGLTLSPLPFIAHPSVTFTDHFAEDVLRFKEELPEEDSGEEDPLTVRKCFGLRLFPKKTGSFLSSFLGEESADPYCLEVLRPEGYYDRKDPLTHNRVAVYRDFLPKVSLTEVRSFVSSHPGLISSVSYSSPIYTYTASGYISGFEKPFFFAKDKEKLNSIEDESAFSTSDLGAFQGSGIAVPEGVIKADLLSAADNAGLSFCSLDGKNLLPLSGTAPKTTEEIGISRGMAKKLFSHPEDAVGEKLYTLMLEKTKKADDGYQNLYSEGELLISALYEEDRVMIYQDPLFPLSYAFAHTSLDPSEIRIQEAVLKADLSRHDAEYYEAEIRKSGDFTGSFPMLSMVKEIRLTLDRLSKLFLALSFLSLLSAVFLLSLVLYLILRRDQKEIGILLSLGYRREEIFRFYWVFAETLGFFGFLLSLGISLFTEKILRETLSSLLSAYDFRVFPYLLSFVIAFSLTGLIGLFLGVKIRKLSPKDAFLRGH